MPCNRILDDKCPVMNRLVDVLQEIDFIKLDTNFKIQLNHVQIRIDMFVHIVFQCLLVSFGFYSRGFIIFDKVYFVILILKCCRSNELIIL